MFQKKKKAESQSPSLTTCRFKINRSNSEIAFLLLTEHEFKIMHNLIKPAIHLDPGKCFFSMVHKHSIIFVSKKNQLCAQILQNQPCGGFLIYIFIYILLDSWSDSLENRCCLVSDSQKREYNCHTIIIKIYKLTSIIIFDLFHNQISIINMCVLL